MKAFEKILVFVVTFAAGCKTTANLTDSNSRDPDKAQVECQLPSGETDLPSGLVRVETFEDNDAFYAGRFRDFDDFNRPVGATGQCDQSLLNGLNDHLTFIESKIRSTKHNAEGLSLLSSEFVRQVNEQRGRIVFTWKATSGNWFVVIDAVGEMTRIFRGHGSLQDFKRQWGL